MYISPLRKKLRNHSVPEAFRCLRKTKWTTSINYNFNFVQMKLHTFREYVSLRARFITPWRQCTFQLHTPPSPSPVAWWKRSIPTPVIRLTHVWSRTAGLGLPLYFLTICFPIFSVLSEPDILILLPVSVLSSMVLMIPLLLGCLSLSSFRCSLSLRAGLLVAILIKATTRFLWSTHSVNQPEKFYWIDFETMIPCTLRARLLLWIGMGKINSPNNGTVQALLCR